MKYRGFRKETLLAAVQELESLGLKPSEVNAILNLAGAKWRAVQIREGRGEELQDEEDSLVFHEATVAIMQATMAGIQQLAKLGHSTEGERFMLLGISIAMNGLFSRGHGPIGRWLRGGDRKAKETVLSFAMGASVLAEAQAIDSLVQSVVMFRYGVKFEEERDLSAPILAVIGKLGNSGYACLNPVVDATKKGNDS